MTSQCNGLPSPTGCKARIQLAEQAGEPSLPHLSQDQDHTTTSEEGDDRRPRHLYDVGLREISHNTPFVPRSQTILASRPSFSNRSTLLSKNQLIESKVFQSGKLLTSTPSLTTRNGNFLHSKQREIYKTRKTDDYIPEDVSPHGSRISPDEIAERNRDNMIIVSTSGSETEKEKPLSSSDSGDNSFNSKNSIGDIDLAELDHFENPMELDYQRSRSVISKSKTTKPLPIGHRSASPKPHSPARSNPSSSQSTLIAGSSTSDPQNEFATASSSINPDLYSHVSSPGIGRRDSPRAIDQYSVEEIKNNLDGDASHDFESSHKNDLTNSSPSHRVEKTSAYRPVNQTPGVNPFINLARRKSILLSNLKSATALTKLRPARIFHSNRKLAEVADDTSDFSGTINQPELLTRSDSLKQVEDADSDSTRHDLTTYAPNRHSNGNTSFPGGDRSQRFNGAKLNSFLHTLNSQLTEENQQLLKQLAETNKELQNLREIHLRSENPDREINDDDEASRSVRSSGALIGRLEEIIENHSGIEDLQNKFIKNNGINRESESHSSSKVVVLERRIRNMQNQAKEKDAEIKSLRNNILEKGTVPEKSHFVAVFDLQDEISQLKEDLLRKDNELSGTKMEKIELSGQHAIEVAELRAELQQAEDMLTQAKEELDQARAETELVKTDFATKMDFLKSQVSDVLGEQDHNLSFNISQLNEARTLAQRQAEEIAQLQQRLSINEQSLKVSNLTKSNLEKMLHQNCDDSPGRSAERRVSLLQGHIKSLEGIISTKEKIAQDSAFTAAQAAEQNASERQRLQRQINELQESVTQITQELSDESVRANKLEEALRDSEKRNALHRKEITDLQVHRDILEADVVSFKSTIKGLEVKLARALESAFSEVTLNASRSRPSDKAENQDSELREAYQEISRLKACLASPNGSVNSEIQGIKIKALEAQRDQLEARVSALRHQASALASTPSRSHIFKSVISMRTPKTPNQMLANMTTFANESNGADETIVPMLNQIHELQHQIEQLRNQLDLANSNVDNQIARLAQADGNLVDLSASNLIAQARVKELEAQLNKFTGESGIINKVNSRLSELECPECGETFDANPIVKLRVVPQTQEVELTLEGSQAESEESSRRFRKKANIVESPKERDLDRHEDQSNGLEELNLQLKEHREINEKLDEEIENLREKLGDAQSKIEGLEAKLNSERESNQRYSFSSEKAAQERNVLETKLNLATEQLDGKQQELAKVIEERHSLEAEVRALLHRKDDVGKRDEQIASLKTEIDRLERQNAAIADENILLERKISSLQKELERKTQMTNNSEKAYHRVQSLLEKQSLELSHSKEELRDRCQEVAKLHDSKINLVNEAQSLRIDLSHVMEQVQALNLQVNQLKSQSDSQSVGLPKKGSFKSEGNRKRNAIEQKHNLECKGLLLRIKFLKLMYTRENFFRADLATQKRLLIKKLAETEKRNEAIQAALDDFGLPSSSQPGNFTLNCYERSFKGVALAVFAICKMRKLSVKWKSEELVKNKLKDAYREVRGKEFVDD